MAGAHSGALGGGAGVLALDKWPGTSRACPAVPPADADGAAAAHGPGEGGARDRVELRAFAAFHDGGGQTSAGQGLGPMLSGSLVWWGVVMHVACTFTLFVAFASLVLLFAMLSAAMPAARLPPQHAQLLRLLCFA